MDLVGKTRNNFLLNLQKKRFSRKQDDRHRILVLSGSEKAGYRYDQGAGVLRQLYIFGNTYYLYNTSLIHKDIFVALAQIHS